MNTIGSDISPPRRRLRKTHSRFELLPEDRPMPFDLGLELTLPWLPVLLEPVDPNRGPIEAPRPAHDATGDDDGRDPAGLLAYGGPASRRNDVAAIRAPAEDLPVEAAQQAHRGGWLGRCQLLDVLRADV